MINYYIIYILKKTIDKEFIEKIFINTSRYFNHLEIIFLNLMVIHCLSIFLYFGLILFHLLLSKNKNNNNNNIYLKYFYYYLKNII